MMQDEVRGLAFSAMRADDIAMPPPDSIPLVFTGNGAEYFRVWAVNMSLTILTLGLYGPWAKVRRLRYFYRHTQLDGTSFDYLAQPGVILRGWCIALALFAGYSFGSEYSTYAGAILSIAMCLVMPYLLWRSNQFKAKCARYRGLTFHFSGSVARAYFAYFPLVAVIFGFPLLTILYEERLSEIQFLWIGALFALALPFLHGVSRNYVQAHLWYGSEKAQYGAGAKQTTVIWFKGLLAIFAISLAAIFVSAIGGAIVFFIRWIFLTNPGAIESKALAEFQLLASSLLLGWLAYQSLGTYYATQFQNVIWSCTRFGDLKIQSDMSFWTLYKLKCKNTFLVILTLGLYRPFAAINVAKYRLSCIRVAGWDQLDAFAVGPKTSLRGALGDSAAGTFEMDLAL